MSNSSLPAKAIHKLYRLRCAIREMEQHVKNDPSKLPALEELRRMLREWSPDEWEKVTGGTLR
jgi:hypothetical protein